MATAAGSVVCETERLLHCDSIPYEERNGNLLMVRARPSLDSTGTDWHAPIYVAE